MPRGYIGRKYFRCVAYYEFKDVPVKSRIYRYWYLRIRHQGRMRSIYCGPTRPDLSPLKAAAELAKGADLVARFRAWRSPHPKLHRRAPTPNRETPPPAPHDRARRTRRRGNV